MSDDRSLRNCKLVFTTGVVFNINEADGMVYSAALPLDGYQLKEIIEGFENRSLAMKEMSGYMESGKVRLPFENVYELQDFLDYTDKLIEESAGAVSIEKMRAALELEGCNSINEARYVVDNLDAFDYFVAIEDAEELGKRLLKDMMPDSLFDTLEWVLDAEAYGCSYIDNNDYACCFASTGFIQQNDKYTSFERSQIGPTM